MLSELALAVSLALSPAQCATCGPGGGYGGSYGGGYGASYSGGGGGMEFSPGMGAGSWSAGYGNGMNPYDSVNQGGGGGGDQLYPIDSTEPWLHGWFQEIPAYGGYHTFRPHNYKHVLAQMEVGGRWGMSPMMPYSHQYYNPYRQRAGMHPDFGSPQASYRPGRSDELSSSGATFASASNPQVELQQVSAHQRGYTESAIPGNSAPYYQAPINQVVSQASREQLDRIEQLQRQIEQQSFQMQMMQEQLRAGAQPWQAPNTVQPPEYQQQLGYQELPPPGATAPAQPALMMPAQPTMNYVPRPSAYPPAGAMNQPFFVPQGYQQSQQYAPSVPMNVPQTSSLMAPQGQQAYFATEQAMPHMAPGFGGQTGATHATYIAPPVQGYQAPAPVAVPQYPTAPNPNASYNYGAQPQAPQQVFYPPAGRQLPGPSTNHPAYRPSTRYGR